jgi:AraC-like DNA-binding protein
MDSEKGGYPRRLQAAIEYIEENLQEELALKEVAARAFASLYHFHRLFRALVGQSLKEYIRCRRLVLAARELVTTRRSVTEIALSYRYSAPESFLRAFKGLFAVTPQGVPQPGSSARGPREGRSWWRAEGAARRSLPRGCRRSVEPAAPGADGAPAGCRRGSGRALRDLLRRLRGLRGRRRRGGRGLSLPGGLALPPSTLPGQHYADAAPP